MDNNTPKRTPAQAGQKGGFTKWARIPKKKRGAMMKKVAEARWKKHEMQTS